MFTYILYGLFILACFILIVVILLQPGKADAGALFSNTISSTAFGPRGTASLLAKITIGAAVAFMLIALMLGLPFTDGITIDIGVDTGKRAAREPEPIAGSGSVASCIRSCARDFTGRTRSITCGDEVDAFFVVD